MKIPTAMSTEIHTVAAMNTDSAFSLFLNTLFTVSSNLSGFSVSSS